MLFQLNAQLGSSYNSTFSKAQQQIAAMQKELQALSKTQSDIAALQKQQNAVEATRQKLTTLQQQYDNIQKEIKETEGYSSSLENKLLSKQQQIDKTSASLEQQTQKLQQMDAALKEAGVDTGNLTGASSKLSTQIEDLKAKQEEAASGAANFGGQSVAAFGAIQQAIAAAGITAALHEIYEAYMECVTIAGNFEEGMSNVEALSGATADEMAHLSDKAKELGATTKFTAQEASDAMGYMAMAGWDAQEMLSGMDGVLQLAAASGEDLAMVSDIVTDNLTAFGLTAADTARFADVLAAAATNSNTNVSIMGETFKMSASIAGALGYSVEDVAIAVGLMANSGVKGSIAGTALKNTFNGLLEGVTLTGAAFGEYDYTAVKADGTMKSFSDTIDELRVYFDQMSEAERVNNAMTIAGQRGYNGLLAILNATDEDYASLTNNINNCTGAAQRMAAVKLDNMNGQLTIMKSAWDGLKISLGEQFTPVMRNLYSLGTDLFDLLNSFVKEHPALVKAAAAFVAVLGAVVVGLTAFVAITKVVIPLMGLLTASIPGVNIIMGVAAGVAAVTAAVVGFVSAANEGVPSVKELTEAARGMREAMDDAKATYDDTVTSTMAAAGVADTYIGKLEELEAAGLNTDEQHRQYHNTLALLCQVVPELAEYIDLETDTINGGTAALRANTEAWKQNAMQQAYQEQLTALYSQYSAVLIEAEENSIGLTKAQYQQEEANKKYNDTVARMNELWNEAAAEAEAYNEEYYAMTDATNFLTQEYYDLENSLYDINDEMWAAEQSAKNYQKAIEEDQEAVAAAEEEIALAEEAVENLTAAMQENSGETAEAAEQEQALQDAVIGTMEQVNELATAYQEAYEAAFDSISGQYQLWDEAAEIVATSAGTINSALESQVAYWETYNANLQSLTERSADIEGLSEMIASFADGSSDSVNAIAGMAGATDEQLADMVANWQTLQEEQENVSGSIADLKTDFTNTMDELQTELAADIEAMDLGNEAAESGKSTIQGFINGANGMLPQVQAAYSSIAQAAIDAIDAKLDIHSPSRVMMEKADMTWAGYINETKAMQPKLEEAMATAAGAGVDAVSEDDMQMFSFAPQLISALSSFRGADFELGAELGGRGGGDVSLQITFRIEGNATPETVEALREYGDEFAERVLEVMEEAGIDTARRAYK
jgi:TP901 family phage tail tape measure protein